MRRMILKFKEKTMRKQKGSSVKFQCLLNYYAMDSDVVNAYLFISY